ncbi:hypothetical protein M409DRAFT_56365 [Zasmidium cellare ATCC 36951]|uniref:Zn(2)-C6 fungal-type domain-containing protein n=1 Tax=Zasmidium cellare ATCC 36951 TaxID=1080233 RepID=A0A6A6CCP7_ZASCE|nr:uncharacterized protein M409DRAFT_56365 [Zasmidium cellare ATCC 36951]KAF2164523.1 hypothetical protein M409DRAFT_56365 [Zasmidium cellare ATCC 36951]
MSEESSALKQEGAGSSMRAGKRSTTLAACRRCRQRKKRCDGNRPTCSECERSNIACDYKAVAANETRGRAARRHTAALQMQLDEIAASLTRLKLMSHDDAVFYLSTLRSASDPVTVLRSVGNGIPTLPVSVSESSNILRILHSTRTGLDCALGLEHPKLYPLLPMETGASKEAVSQEISPASRTRFDKTTYAAVEPVAVSFAGHFRTAALRLSKALGNDESIMNVASLFCLTVGSICSGDDAGAKDHLRSSLRMSVALRLHGKDSADPTELGLFAPDWLSAYSHVAWSSYNFCCIYISHYRSKDWMDFHSVCISGSRESCISRPSALIRRGEVSKAAGMGGSTPCGTRFVERHAASRGNPAISMSFHSMVMELFRPFLGRKLRLAWFPYPGTAPEEVFVSSANRMVELFRFYHTKFKDTSFAHTITWLIAPVYTAHISLKGVADTFDQRRLDFQLCADALMGLGVVAPMKESIVRGIMNMAIQGGLFDVRESKKVLAKVFEGHAQ